MELIYEFIGLLMMILPLGISFAIFVWCLADPEWHLSKWKMVLRFGAFLVLMFLSLSGLHAILSEAGNGLVLTVVSIFLLFPAIGALVTLSVMTWRGGMWAERAVAIIGGIVALVSGIIPMYYQVSGMWYSASEQYKETIGIPRLAESDEARAYLSFGTMDLATWKTFTSRDGFYTVTYPSWWVVKEEYGSSWGGDNCTESGCEDREDHLVDSIEYEGYLRNSRIEIEYYIGLLNPQIPDRHMGQKERMTEVKRVLLGDVYPAIQGIYTTNDGVGHAAVMTTEPIHGAHFFIRNEEPKGMHRNLPIFEKVIESFHVIDGVDPIQYDLHEVNANWFDRLIERFGLILQV